jgi:phage/plasmid-associated DNA primase
MIDGCREWQRIGLAPPAIVQAATEEYLAGEDALGQWLDECCKLDAGATERSVDLFKSWKSWVEARGEFAGSHKKFSQALEAKKFVKAENGWHQAIFCGLQLRAHGEPADGREGRE